MTTPCSGQLNWSDVNVELGHAWNTAMDINYTPVRQLAGVGGSGTPISFSDLRCKSWYIREPASGWYYDGNTRWEIGTRGSMILGRVRWGGIEIGYANSTVATSASFDGWTYYRGALRSGTGNTNGARYEIYRDRYGQW